MNGLTDSYAKVLFDLTIPEEYISETKRLCRECPELVAALASPVVSRKEKHAVIDKVIPEPVRSFFKVVSDNSEADSIFDIFESYDELVLGKKEVASAVFSYVTKPDEERLLDIKKMICQKYNKTGVDLRLVEDPSLIGGFVLTVGDDVYDRSVKASIAKLQNSLVRR
ncbi:ATP synthase F1 subunit delta [Anaerostipes sp.]|uniref:ATP synthase F1 subunit delta n=1 Tax=Anaerostipes sp. TaxID=1872530 RepID=UPI0025C5C33B|nr:ATP synthase F1 subunit delta [Anaerostipes sp.]MBS7008281.1 ATP synthase F1 subunit delta [Anaerostipes sp.]